MFTLFYYSYAKWTNPFLTITSQVDSDTGEVKIRDNTPGGVYRFDVTVADDGTYPAVVSTVIINVKDITMEAVQSSGSFRFEDVTAEEFIAKPDPDKPSKIEALQEILADILPAKYENIDIFSIINLPGMDRVIDVRYSAHGSPVYPASQLNAAALANLDRVSVRVYLCENFHLIYFREGQK